MPLLLSSQFALWYDMCSSVQRTEIFHYGIMFVLHILIILISKYIQNRSELPHRLNRTSASTRFLGLLVRIPRVYVYLSVVNVVCCLFEVSATGRFIVQRVLLFVYMCVCVCH